MRIGLAALFSLLLALPLSASDRERHRALVAEVLALVDVRALTAAVVHARIGAADDQQDRAMERRILADVDYTRIEEEVFAPLFAKNFTTAELQELVAFYKTKAGQKAAKLLPDVALTLFFDAADLLHSELAWATDEIEQEARKLHPERATMADLRTIATCLEARATDENDYPSVPFAALPPLLEPTYVKKLPRVDAWGTPFAYVSDGVHYRVISAGADGRFDPGSLVLDLRELPPVESSSLDADIVFQDGNFTRFPKGSIPEP